MSDAVADIDNALARIRQAAARAFSGPLADAHQRPCFPGLASESPSSVEASRDDHLARFRAELEALAGRVYGPLDAGSATGKVIELVTERGAHSILAWSDEEIVCPGLGDALARASTEIVSGEVTAGANRRIELEKLAVLKVGLTGAVAALADTGSIVVASGRGRARIASLLPPIHIAVVPVARLYPTMLDWLSEIAPVSGSTGGGLVCDAANVVIITGPSRTADIELQLALGVHGPKEVHVVLLES